MVIKYKVLPTKKKQKLSRSKQKTRHLVLKKVFFNKKIVNAFYIIYTIISCNFICNKKHLLH